MMQIAFTYIGTIVGAGFATGREILQFFTQYGWSGTITIIIASGLFVWLGIKLMVIAYHTKTTSFEDLNIMLFGKNIGVGITLFIILTLLVISSVVLAGAGALFSDFFHFPMQLGLLFTLLITFFVISHGIKAIFMVNSIVVPIMFIFIGIVVFQSLTSSQATNFLHLDAEAHPFRVWLSPFLYTAFNLILAQSLLVPIGAKIQNKSTIVGGGLIGGLGIGVLLFSIHLSLSSQMPLIAQFEIPMGYFTYSFHDILQVLFLLVIFLEILTTLIANIYGLTTQLNIKYDFPFRRTLSIVLLCCFLISQIGFSNLLSTLYPLIGFISCTWLLVLMFQSSRLAR